MHVVHGWLCPDARNIEMHAFVDSLSAGLSSLEIDWVTWVIAVGTEQDDSSTYPLPLSGKNLQRLGRELRLCEDNAWRWSCTSRYKCKATTMDLLT